MLDKAWREVSDKMERFQACTAMPSSIERGVYKAYLEVAGFRNVNEKWVTAKVSNCREIILDLIECRLLYMWKIDGVVSDEARIRVETLRKELASSAQTVYVEW